MNTISSDNNLLKYFTFDDLNKISNFENINFKAKVIVTILFKGKIDEYGEPYIRHLIRVSESLLDPIEKVAGLLHDVFEDTEITEKDLFEIGIPDEIIEIVKLVTHDRIDNITNIEKLELYNSEIDKIINSGNIHAIRLEEADILDNYEQKRLKKLPKKKRELFNEKYEKQLVKLRNVKGD